MAVQVQVQVPHLPVPARRAKPLPPPQVQRDGTTVRP
jgi:hypothetical protein